MTRILALLNIFEGPMRLAQRYLGQQRIAWLFLAPNLIIFSLFTFLPIILNFYYATTGGVQVLPTDRPYVGSDNFRTLLTCDDYLDLSTCDKDIFWKSVFNTAAFVTLQVGFMVLFSLITALILNRRFAPEDSFVVCFSTQCCCRQ